MNKNLFIGILALVVALLMGLGPYFRSRTLPGIGAGTLRQGEPGQILTVNKDGKLVWVNRGTTCVDNRCPENE